MAAEGLVLLQGPLLSCDLGGGYRGFFFFLANVFKDPPWLTARADAGLKSKRERGLLAFLVGAAGAHTPCRPGGLGELKAGTALGGAAVSFPLAGQGCMARAGVRTVGVQARPAATGPELGHLTCLLCPSVLRACDGAVQRTFLGREVEAGVLCVYKSSPLCRWRTLSAGGRQDARPPGQAGDCAHVCCLNRQNEAPGRRPRPAGPGPCCPAVRAALLFAPQSPHRALPPGGQVTGPGDRARARAVSQAGGLLCSHAPALRSTMSSHSGQR